MAFRCALAASALAAGAEALDASASLRGQARLVAGQGQAQTQAAAQTQVQGQSRPYSVWRTPYAEDDVRPFTRETSPFRKS